MIGNAFSYVGSLKSHYQYYSSFCTLPFEVPAPCTHSFILFNITLFIVIHTVCNFLSESNPVGPSLRANFATEKVVMLFLSLIQKELYLKDCPNRYLCLFSVVVILLYVSLLFDLKRQRSMYIYMYLILWTSCFVSNKPWTQS